MHSLTYKLAGIFLAIALIPLGIGIAAALALQNAGASLDNNDRALQRLTGLFESVDATLRENAELQDRALAATAAVTGAQEEMYAALATMGESTLPRTFAVAQMRFGIADVSAAERALLLALNMRHLDSDELKETRAAQVGIINAAMEQLDMGMRRYLALPSEGPEKEAWDEFAQSLDAWRRNHREFMAEIGNLEALVEDLVRGGPLFASASRKAYDTAFVGGKSARDACEDGIDALNAAIAAGTERKVREALDSQVKSSEFAQELGRESTASAAKAADVRGQIETARGATIDASLQATGDLAVTSRRFWYLVGISGVGVCVAVLLGFILTWRISGPIRKMAGHMDRVAEGDLTDDVPVPDRARKDEIGRLARTMQNMIISNREEIRMADAMAAGDYTHFMSPRSDRDQLGKALGAMLRTTNDTLVAVSRAVERVGHGAAGMSAASRSLTEGSLTSASALEEISRTVSHVDHQAKENADHASRANTLATSSRDAAKRGYGAVVELVQAMEEIRAAGAKIATVAKLIDDIAFQTNLLALNAAVEAARAGRQGKGFSVVADEVRNLSGRSAKAARETGDMVLAMTERMESGVKMAKRTDAEFQAIVDATAQVAQLFEDITAASDAQSVAMAQISLSLSQIDEVTQKNAINANSTAAAAQALSEQAEELRRMVSRFRVNGGDVRFAGEDAGALFPHSPPKRVERRVAEAKLLGAPGDSA
ncbi:MAG: methyl-accepting chemotaxis protein [Planctomycetota bacterium]|jgi:methyl-accepting chemotaxis protein|nr:methyl-accepting chemotaxis protein [Planctomycetota bacterium]